MHKNNNIKYEKKEDERQIYVLVILTSSPFPRD